MDQQWSAPAWAVLSVLGLLVVLVLLTSGLAVSLRRGRARARLEGQATRADVEALRAEVADLDRAVRRRRAVEGEAAAAPEFVITRLGDAPATDDAPPSGEPTTVPGPLFADLVLREGVVQAASLAAGVRHALRPESRHRIRFEMRREVKRSRRQRRADVRRARRELRDQGVSDLSGLSDLSDLNDTDVQPRMGTG